jgi:hypothetical protein
MSVPTVVDATSSGVRMTVDELPGRTMFGFSTTASTATS